MITTIKKTFILLISILIVTCSACSSEKEAASTQTSETVSEVETVEAFGTIDLNKNDIVNVNIDFPIVIEKINVKEGQKVKKGDALISFSSKDFTDQIKNKEYELNIAKLELSKATDSLFTNNDELKLMKKNLTAKKNALSSNSDPDIKKLINDLSFAKASLAQADKELQVQQKLYTSGAISLHDYDEYKKTAELKTKEVKDAEYALKIMNSKKEDAIKDLETSIAQKISSIGNSDLTNTVKGPSIQILQEKFNLLQAELHSLKSKLSKSFIHNNQLISNYDNSVVYDISVSQGDLVNSGNKLFSIAKLDSLIIKSNISEEFINDVKLGAEATIIPDSNKTKKFKGKVIRIYNTAKVQNGETVVPVEISIEDKDASLMPNLNVDVTIKVN